MAIRLNIVSQFDNRGLKKAENDIAKIGKGISRSLNLAIAGAAVGLGAVLASSAKAAVEDAKSQALLANQLRNTVGANNELIASAEASISQMQSMSSVADDEIRPAFAALVRATGDVGKATSLTTLALNVAAGTGKDLGAVSLALGKAVNGSTTSLLKLVPSIKGASDPMAVLAKEFDGAAEAAARSDPFQRLQIIFGDLQEQIGMGLMPMLNDIADYFDSADFSNAFSDLAVAFYNVGKQLDSLSKQLTGENAMTALVNLAGAAAVGLSEILFILGDIGTTTAKVFSGDFAGAGKQMTTFFDRYNKFVQGIYNEQDAAKAASKVEFKAYSPYVGTTTGGAGGAGASKLAAQNKARADAAKKAADAQKKAIANAVEELNKQRDAIIEVNAELQKVYDNSVESLNNFKLALSDASAGVKPLVLAGRDIGQFEQAVISSFENMTETIKSGLADKTLTTDAAKNLSDYASKEKSVLIAMGKQRDDLFKKRSLAEGLIADVKASIAGLGNITSMVKTEAKMVTQTVTQIINGLSVATTRTVEDVAGTSGLVANFQSVLAKTKAFAVQLKELRRLGLDKNLYQQIVDAGVDAGSVTAQEIIAGGAGTITELNTLFDDLNTVGAQIAEETAQVMYGAGVDVSNGLIAGLLSEEAALVTAAETLANSFLTAFNALVANIQVAPLVQQLVPDVANVLDGTEKVLTDKLARLRVRLDTLGTVQGAAEMATASSLMSQIRSTASELTAVNPMAKTGVSNVTNIKVEVKASAGVNTKKTGQDVANVLAKYTGSNSSLMRVV